MDRQVGHFPGEPMAKFLSLFHGPGSGDDHVPQQVFRFPVVHFRFLVPFVQGKAQHVRSRSMPR